MAGESFVTTDLYGPVKKAHESRLLLAIAAAEGCSVYKTDTSQAFLYGSMENDSSDVVCHGIRAPDWWPEPIPEGHCLQLLKSIYGTRQAARRWHKHISAWMEANGYFAVNSGKTVFMKREGKHFIIHGLFVDDLLHIATNNKLKNEIMEKYSRDLNITGGGLMKTFLGMEIEQSNRSIKLHLDHDMDSFRYLVCSIAVGSILCFGRLIPLGSTLSLDRVHRGPSKLQDHLSPPNQAQPVLRQLSTSAGP